MSRDDFANDPEQPPASAYPGANAPFNSGPSASTNYSPPLSQGGGTPPHTNPYTGAPTGGSGSAAPGNDGAPTAPTTGPGGYGPNSIYWTSAGIWGYVSHYDNKSGQQVYTWTNLGGDPAAVSAATGMPVGLIQQQVAQQQKQANQSGQARLVASNPDGTLTWEDGTGQLVTGDAAGARTAGIAAGDILQAQATTAYAQRRINENGANTVTSRNPDGTYNVQMGDGRKLVLSREQAKQQAGVTDAEFAQADVEGNDRDWKLADAGTVGAANFADGAKGSDGGRNPNPLLPFPTAPAPPVAGGPAPRGPDPGVLPPAGGSGPTPGPSPLPTDTHTPTGTSPPAQSPTPPGFVPLPEGVGGPDTAPGPAIQPGSGGGAWGIATSAAPASYAAYAPPAQQQGTSAQVAAPYSEYATPQRGIPSAYSQFNGAGAAQTGGASAMTASGTGQTAYTAYQPAERPTGQPAPSAQGYAAYTPPANGASNPSKTYTFGGSGWQGTNQQLTQQEQTLNSQYGVGASAYKLAHQAQDQTQQDYDRNLQRNQSTLAGTSRTVSGLGFAGVQPQRLAGQ
jgi:hypothetical protein